MQMLRFLGIPVAMAALPALCELAFRKAYDVPPPGSGVLITGTSSGIGRHAALALAKEGYVVFAGVRKKADVEAWAAEATALAGGAGAGKVVPVIIDVADTASVNACVDNVTKLLDAGSIPLAAVVNNAGMNMDGVVELVPMDKVEYLFRVNVFGAMHLTQRLLPRLRRDKGRIVFISSVAGKVSPPRWVPYAMSKHALEALAAGLRAELTPFGVSVSNLNPGFVKTSIFDRYAASVDYPAAAASLYPLPPDHAAQLQALEAASPGPEVTSAAISHAISSRHPRTSYIVAHGGDGLPAWAVLRLRWLLPDRAWDALLLRTRR